jgi:leader peptidase (prepilin peptidase)/N-methyltransferase
MTILFASAVAFVLGACIGSFAGVVAYRLPREISILAPRSFCPKCKQPISPLQNIPIVSYLMLHGRCAKCGAPIELRYFLIEAVLAVTAVYLYLHFSLFEALARFIFCAALVVIALIDYEWRVIHNAITLIGTVLGFAAAALLLPEVGWRSSLAGIAVGSGFLLLTGMVYSLIRGAEGVGMGDVYLLGMTGAFLGWPGALFTLFAGSIFGSVGGLALALSGEASRQPEEVIPEAIAEVTACLPSDPEASVLRTAVPFGPFLAFAAAVFAVFQPQLLHWYLTH